jgi:hypothetical protein
MRLSNVDTGKPPNLMGRGGMGTICGLTRVNVPELLDLDDKRTKINH